ncbi:hypothetical protein SAMN05660649_00485 [Desulfotomaculum arcticum]|uniref:Uncharacterized protein n=2 Tax=Desulfotruncus TaxID=2867377 RepID=A0A1I2NK56_9FIRM|nr:hypothetical protein SAMN05660649_00485 [Desulfotomaculum arcticum] [Desulfotruncus arcticus DSM 17038]
MSSTASSNSLGRCNTVMPCLKKDKGDVLMELWKKLYCWMVRNLEEPFFLAEMHRVKTLPVKTETRLRLIKGNKKNTKNYPLLDLKKKICAK